MWVCLPVFTRADSKQNQGVQVGYKIQQKGTEKMTFEELYENEEFRSEIEKIMREKNNPQDMAEILVAEAKKHGVETDENEIHAYFVSKMPVSEDEMDNLAAGDIVCVDSFGCTLMAKCRDIVGGACIALDSCYTAMLHDDSNKSDEACSVNHSCWSNYQCVTVYSHSRCAVIYNCAISQKHGD